MREYFTNNLGLKLVALILALSIEVYFKSPQNLATEVVRVPVELRTSSEKKALISPRLDLLSIAVKVRGPRPLIQELQGSAHQFHIDLPVNPPEVLPYQLRKEDLDLPLGVEVLEIVPARIELKFEQITSKTVAVKPIMQGKTPAGYSLNSVKILPESVVVKGPVSALRKWSEIETQPIDLSKITETKSLEVYLSDPAEQNPELGSKISLDVNVVEVRLDVRPRREVRTFARVPVFVKGGSGEAAEPSVVSVVVSGAEKMLSEIKEGEIQAVIELSSEEGSTARVQVGAPAGVTVEKVTPDSVKVVGKKNG